MDSSTVGLKNQSYSEQELDIVRRSRRVCTEKLQVLRDEIQRLCSETEQLEIQIHRFDIALAPHNKLPSEVLRRVFGLCCVEPAQIPAQNEGLYAISHVCSFWRRIALDTPELWANVSIKLKQSNEHRIQIARRWLSRAGSYPRSLTITNTAYNLDVWGQRILHNLVIHYPCRELRLTHPDNSQVTPLKELLASDKPLGGYLEVLDFDISHVRGLELVDDPRHELFTPTTNLTKLTHVRLVGAFNCQHLMTAVPWSQLRYLTLLVGISASRCLDILSQCAALIRCRIHVENGPVAMASSRRPITLPTLRLFRLLFTMANEPDPHVEQLI